MKIYKKCIACAVGLEFLCQFRAVPPSAVICARRDLHLLPSQLYRSRSRQRSAIAQFPASSQLFLPVLLGADATIPSFSWRIQLQSLGLYFKFKSENFRVGKRLKDSDLAEEE